MTFERRRSQTYYYQKRWLNGHVVSEYLGKGYRARLAAKLRRERLAHAQRAQAERDEWAEQDAALDRLEESLRLVVQAYLLTPGCHIHKRQWRQTRDKKK